MALEPDQAARLAHRLKELREQPTPNGTLTQAQLATAFSTEAKLTGPTISAWESASNPKTPTPARLSAYARFFATQRSLDGPRLLPEEELTVDERRRYVELKAELYGLLNAPSNPLQNTSAFSKSFAFKDGPVIVICPDAPGDMLGPLAQQNDPNFTKLQRYGDLDALIEIFGHLRASNPDLEVLHRLAGEATADDLLSHVILLGGVAWNQVTKRFQESIRQVPITQVEVDGYPGDVFELVDAGEANDKRERFNPKWEDDGRGGQHLIEDVAFLARLPNPFNGRRTLTICNGVHSRGVYGAVRCLTDQRVCLANEQYLADRFPNGQFALLFRVPVVGSKVLSPDLQNPDARLYEWSPPGGADK
jgi:transcriptional regulator with XRE-family HTH domain